MSLPDAARLMAALDATWPAYQVTEREGWRIRDGRGGGKRVSAASRLDPGAEVAVAEAAQRALGQTPLFRLALEDTALDAQLAGLGYRVLDPTLLYAAPIADLAQMPPPVRLFDIWPPLAIMRDIWAEAGIGRERLAVMARAPAPRTGFVARIEDRACGTAFLAIHEGIAMIHAIEIAPRARRKGVAATLMRGAAHWAQEAGAAWIALAVTQANAPARALYDGLGMQVAGRYHYREEAGA